MTTNNFWDCKDLADFSEEEWESICTHCGRCCLVKLQDEDSDEICYTNVVCRYFNHEDCHCTEYQNRCQLVPSCLKLSVENVDNIIWMPQSCAYRILNETGELPTWHPLITGQPLDAKHSVKGRVVSENLVNDEDLEDHIDEDFNE